MSVHCGALPGAHDIRDLGSVGGKVLGKACHYAHYHVTNSRVFNVNSKPYTFLIPTNNALFFVKFYLFGIGNNTCKEPPEISSEIGRTYIIYIE